MKKSTTHKTEIFYRDFPIRAHDDDSRTVDLSFSSEEPVERWFGLEVLDHGDDSVRMDRLQNGAPLLVDHDARDVVGVIESADIQNNRGVARARFGNSDRANEIFQDVKDGIRHSVSVGYRVLKAVLEEHDSDGLESYRITDWLPIEISLVSVPADASVGIGRSNEQADKNDLVLIREIPDDIPEQINSKSEVFEMSEEVSTPDVDVQAITDAAREEEHSRVRQISAVGAQCEQGDLAEQYIRDGRSVEDFQTEVLKRMKKPVAPDADVSGDAANIGMSDGEVQRYSFVKLIRALSNPTDRRAQRDAEFELSCSEAEDGRRGTEGADGVRVPNDVLTRDLSVGTNTAGGHTVSTDLLSQSFIELLRNKMKVREAGATILTGLEGNIAIPRQTSGATAYWVAEAVAPSESQQAFDQLSMSPNTVGAYTDFSRKLMLQSSLDIEAFVRNDLATVLALEIDRAAINGSGSGAEPTGILNTSGIGDVAGGTNGLAPTFDHFVDLETDVAVANADVGNLRYMTNAAVRGKTKKTLADSGSGEYVWPRNSDSINGYEVSVTNQVPSDLDKGSSSGVCSAIIFGNWADLIVGEWGGLSLVVDPYTSSTTGTVRIVALQDIDIGLRHVASFSAMQDALTS